MLIKFNNPTDGGCCRPRKNPEFPLKRSVKVEAVFHSGSLPTGW